MRTGRVDLRLLVGRGKPPPLVELDGEFCDRGGGCRGGRLLQASSGQVKFHRHRRCATGFPSAPTIPPACVGIGRGRPYIENWLWSSRIQRGRMHPALRRSRSVLVRVGRCGRRRLGSLAHGRLWRLVAQARPLARIAPSRTQDATPAALPRVHRRRFLPPLAPRAATTPPHLRTGRSRPSMCRR